MYAEYQLKSFILLNPLIKPIFKLQISAGKKYNLLKYLKIIFFLKEKVQKNLSHIIQ